MYNSPLCSLHAGKFKKGHLALNRTTAKIQKVSIMSIPTPAKREHVHTRSINYLGFRREDGLWDIEAQMTDTKTYSFQNDWRGEVQSGVPLHEMILRVTIDSDFIIHDVYAETKQSPFEMCPNIVDNYRLIIGLRMGPGWRKEIRMKIGGTKGCTHITELLFPMGTVARQTIWPLIKKERSVSAERHAKKNRRPGVLNTCHAWASDSNLVKTLAPDFYTGED